MERNRKWAIQGRLAAIARSSHPDKPRLAFETDLATRLGLSRGALRNYSDAARLVREIPDHELRTLLFRSSAVAASTTARWYRRDPDAVYAYLRDGLAGDPPRIVDDRALLRAARSAITLPSPSANHRTAPTPPNVATQLKTIVDAPRLTWRSEIAHAVPGLVVHSRYDNFALIDPSDPLSRFLGISNALVTIEPGQSPKGDPAGSTAAHSQSMVIGFIDIDPMVTLERYRSQARSIWTRAIAANAYLGGMVVVVVPNSAARRHMLSRIPMAGADWINHPQAPLPRPASPHSCRSRPVLARLGKHVIMVSTRRSLVGDLFDYQPSPDGPGQ
jgi:hypothetical protein